MSEVRSREDCSLKAGNPLIFRLNVSFGPKLKINAIWEFESNIPTFCTYLIVFVKWIKKPPVTLFKVISGEASCRHDAVDSQTINSVKFTFLHKKKEKSKPTKAMRTEAAQALELKTNFQPEELRELPAVITGYITNSWVVPHCNWPCNRKIAKLR